jgi:hypothetical protein
VTAPLGPRFIDHLRARAHHLKCICCHCKLLAVAKMALRSNEVGRVLPGGPDKAEAEIPNQRHVSCRVSIPGDCRRVVWTGVGRRWIPRLLATYGVDMPVRARGLPLPPQGL